MPRYEVVGIGKHTGRQRVKIYDVANEDAAIVAASADGTIVDMSNLRVLPEKPPTNSEIEYAKGYGIKIPKGMSGKELSAQTTKAEYEDWPRIETITRAKRLKIKIPTHITDDELEDLITEKEDKLEDEKDFKRERLEDARDHTQRVHTQSTEQPVSGIVGGGVALVALAVILYIVAAILNSWVRS